MNIETLRTFVPGLDWDAIASLPQDEAVTVVLDSMRQDVSKSQQIETALCARTVYLRDDCGRSAASIADELTVSVATVSRWYDRGRILTLTGPTTSLKVLSQLAALPNDRVKQLQAECLSLTTPEDRSAHVQDVALRSVASAALGDAATDERVTSLAATLAADGNTAPTAARKAAEATATRLGFPCAKPGRKAGEDDGSNAPTFAKVLAALERAIADRRAADDRLTVTVEEAAILEDIMDKVADFIGEATVARPVKVKANA